MNRNRRPKPGAKVANGLGYRGAELGLFRPARNKEDSPRDVPLRHVSTAAMQNCAIAKLDTVLPAPNRKGGLVFLAHVRQYAVHSPNMQGDSPMPTFGFSAVTAAGPSRVSNGLSVLLRAQQQARSLSEEDFAALLGIRLDSLTRFLRGVAMPSFDERREMAKALGYASTMDLEDAWRDGRFEMPNRAGAGWVPIINKVPGSDPVDYAEWSFDSSWAPELVKAPPGYEGEMLFALIVIGDSMEPTYRAGDLVFFRPLAANADPADATPVCARWYDERCTFKRIFHDPEPGWWDLRPENPAHRAVRVAADELVRVAEAVEHTPGYCTRRAINAEPQVVRDEFCSDCPED